MSRVWIAVLVASLISYGLKLSGYIVPARLLQHPVAARIAPLLPAALLAALVVVQTFSSGARLTVDARVAGLAVAALALVLRAPFLVVVVAAAGTAALVRAAGWG
jgi:Branched-chain amino acid transport protein (AzlD)